MILNLLSNGPCKDNIKALQEMVKTRMPTITKQSLRPKLVFHKSWTLTNNHMANR
jgi:hypothetical protein